MKVSSVGNYLVGLASILVSKNVWGIDQQT